jgi:hypothetical protein
MEIVQITSIRVFDALARPLGHLSRIAFIGLLTVLSVSVSSAQNPSPQPGPPRLGVQDYDPITAKGRAKWFAVSTARGAVTGSVFSAAWGTGIGRPEEYPNNWEGFGRRYRQSLAGVVTGNAIEASVGAIWGEDPRYFPTNMPIRGNLGAKIKHVIVSTFTSTNRRGETMPAYAFLSRSLPITSCRIHGVWKVNPRLVPLFCGLRSVSLVV